MSFVGKPLAVPILKGSLPQDLQASLLNEAVRHLQLWFQRVQQDLRGLPIARVAVSYSIKRQIRAGLLLNMYIYIFIFTETSPLIDAYIAAK